MANTTLPTAARLLEELRGPSNAMVLVRKLAKKVGIEVRQRRALVTTQSDALASEIEDALCRVGNGLLPGDCWQLVNNPFGFVERTAWISHMTLRFERSGLARVPDEYAEELAKVIETLSGSKDVRANVTEFGLRWDGDQAVAAHRMRVAKVTVPLSSQLMEWLEARREVNAAKFAEIWLSSNKFWLKLSLAEKTLSVSVTDEGVLDCAKVLEAVEGLRLAVMGLSEAQAGVDELWKVMKAMPPLARVLIVGGFGEMLVNESELDKRMLALFNE